MTDLLNEVLTAHGGLARWRTLSSVKVDLNVWGPTWKLKEQPGLFERVRVEAKTAEQDLTVQPFVTGNQLGRYSGNRVLIDTPAGAVVEERANPRDAFAGHTIDTPWDHLHGLYFGGYALWNYLNLPFLATWPGFVTEEVTSYRHQGGEIWRRLRVSYPPDVHTHNPVQYLFIDGDGLIVRHDYAPEVVGGEWAAHYLHDYAEFDGIMFPTGRRVFRRGKDLRPVDGLVLIGIDSVGDYELS